MTALAKVWRENHPDGSALELDCAITPNLLTVPNVAALDQLEPFGASCPRPLLYLDNMQVEQLTEVGGGKHLKLRLSRDGKLRDAIFFSTTACKAAIAPGDRVEVAFTPQINEFRGLRTVQLNITDIRPTEDCRREIEEGHRVYARFVANALTDMEAMGLIPPRNEFAAVWRYLTAHAMGGSVTDEISVLSRKISRSAGIPVSFIRTKVCLDVLEERGLIQMEHGPHAVYIKLTPGTQKVDLQNSAILLRLKRHS